MALVGPTFAVAADDVPVAVLTFDRSGVIWVNRRWVTLTGLTRAASLDRGWLTAVHGDDWTTARQFVDTARGVNSIAEWRLLGVDGRDVVWVQATSDGVQADPDGVCVVALTEIDAHKANEAGLLHRALHDPLTGLLNKSAFMARTIEAVDRAATELDLCAALYLDLDYFKDVNDEFGHKCGDHLLSAVSRRIRASLRPSDTLARLGGDEIGVLCPSIENEDEAIRLAERIVRAVSEPFTIDQHVVHTGVSIGIAFSNGIASTAAELVEQADEAMYRAKAAGRGQWATHAQSGPRGAIEPGDVHDVLARVMQAHGELAELIGRLDLRHVEWDRLAEASRALTRATHLLEGDSRIG